METGMYIILNKGLGMSTGKSAAQAAHAAVAATTLSDPRLLSHWNSNGYPKFVMEARDTEHMRNIETYLRDRGFKLSVIIDEGRTEIPSMSLTAIGVEVVDKSVPHVKATFSALKLYRDAPKKNEQLQMELL